MLAQTLLMPCMQTPLMVEPSCWPPVLFYKMSFSALNSVLHACKASTLVAEPSPQPFMITSSCFAVLGMKAGDLSRTFTAMELSQRQGVERPRRAARLLHPRASRLCGLLWADL